MLSKNIIIKEALIDGLFFNYRILQSRHNVIDVFSDDSEPSSLEKKPLRVSIAKINLKNATFEMEHDSGVNIFAQNISAQGNFWVEKGPFFVALQVQKCPDRGRKDSRFADVGGASRTVRERHGPQAAHCLARPEQRRLRPRIVQGCADRRMLF